MEHELEDYSRFVSNGEDIGFGDDQPEPEPTKSDLELWAQRYNGK